MKHPDEKVGLKSTYLNEAVRIEKKKGTDKFYQAPPDWSKLNSLTSLNGHAHKGEFLKENRKTIPILIEESAKKNKIPAPGAYTPNDLYKIPNIAKVQTLKGEMLNEATLKGLETPGHKYEIANAVNFTRPRILYTKFYKPEAPKP
jgi:hypothetical protein